MSTPINLPTLLSIPMSTALPQPLTHQILSQPPFIPLPSALNFRDIGLLPGSPVPRGLIYRSGAITSIPPTALQNLGIKMILDLRCDGNVEGIPDTPIEGIDNIALAPGMPAAPLDLRAYAENGGVPAYKAQYLDVLDAYAPAFRACLEWMLGHVGAPVLVHCTAGKDRTGVLAALLLGLAGASGETIARDYVLTRVGVEPGREMLGGMIKVWNEEWTKETLGMREFVAVREEYVLGFMEGVGEKWGGVEGYVRDGLGFGRAEVDALKGILRGDFERGL